MGYQKFTDTCDWCSKGTNRVQRRGDTFLCPSCCPDVEEESVPEDAPANWHSMREQ